MPGADMVADFADMDSKLIGPPTFVTNNKKEISKVSTNEIDDREVLII